MQTVQNALPARTHNPAVLWSEDDAHLRAYNIVFSELGLRFRWNTETVGWLTSLKCDTEEALIATYITTCQPHLLAAYDVNFLSKLICDMKNERHGITDCRIQH
ncbi:MAG: LysR family transcriptional regulator [Paralcaligenes sp.]